MKFNDDLISKYSERNIENWLIEFLRGDYSKINAFYMELNKRNDRNVDLLQCRLALENYVLKYFKQPKTEELKNAMTKLVKTVGENFSKKRINMLSSLFLQKENLNIFYKENELEIINRAMDSLKKKTFSLYQKFCKGETLSEDEIKILMKYFTYNKDAPTNTNIYKAQVSYLQYLFNDYKDKITNVDELEFVVNFTVTNYFKYFDKHVPKQDVVVGNLGKTTRGQSGYSIVKISDQDVFLNKLEVLKTINHECRHAVQSMDAQLYKKKTSYEMAKRILFSKYLSSKEFNLYEANYRFEDIEKDAEKVGFFKARVMTNMLSNDIQVKKEMDFCLRDMENDSFKRRAFSFAFITDENGNRYFPEDFEFRKLRDILSKYPEEIKRFPVLQLLFNENGSIKGFQELLIAQDSLETAGVSDDFLKVGVKNNLLNNVRLESLSDSEKMALFGKLIFLFEGEVKKIAAAFESYNAAKNIDENTFRNTMLNHINISKKLIEFIGNNVKTIMFLEESDQNSYRIGCSLSIVKRVVENYVRVLNQTDKIDLVKDDLNELEEMLKNNYNHVADVRKNHFGY